MNTLTEMYLILNRKAFVGNDFFGPFFHTNFKS